MAAKPVDSANTTEKGAKDRALPESCSAGDLAGASWKDMAAHASCEKPQSKPLKDNVIDLQKESIYPPEPLSPLALAAKVKVLRDGLSGHTLTSDAGAVKSVLAPLSVADRKAVVAAYEAGKQGSFSKDMAASLKEGDRVSIEALLLQKHEKSNLSGNVASALELAKTDSAKGNELLRTTFMTLNKGQLDELARDFESNYHKPLAQALAENKAVRPETREALPLLMKGVEARSSADVAGLANLAMKYQNLQMFQEVLGSDNAATKEARGALSAKLKDPNSPFSQRFAELTEPTLAVNPEYGATEVPAIWNKQKAGEILSQGRVSLKAIVEENTGRVFDNKENIALALRNATEEERQNYEKGRQEALTTKLKPEQIARLPDDSALKFYTGLHGALQKAGDASEVTAFEDQLRHGKKTVITDLVQSQTDHWFIAKTHSAQDLFSKAENLSRDDWNALHGHKDPQDPYWQELSRSLKTYATAKEQTQIVETLQRQAKAETYEQGQLEKRSLLNIIDHNMHSVGRGGARIFSDGGAVNFVDGVAKISPSDAKRYAGDKDFKDQVDLAVHKLAPTEKAYAQALLTQVARSGKPPELTPDLDILNGKIHNRPYPEMVRQLQTAFSDPALRARLAQSDDKLTPLDRQLKATIEEQLHDAMDASFTRKAANHAAGSLLGAGGKFAVDMIARLGGSQADGKDHAEDAYRALVEKGTVPLAMRIKAGLPMDSDSYRELAGQICGGPEQKAALAALSSRPGELAVALNVSQQGKLQAADLAHAFVSGDAIGLGELKEALSKGSINAIRNDYAKKYAHSGDDFDRALLSKVPPGKVTEFKQLLSGKVPDGSQALFEHIRDRDDSGLVLDGTDKTLSRVTNDYRNAVCVANTNKVELSVTELKRLSDYSDAAMTQYSDSKRALADKTAGAGITVASLAAAPFSGGLSLGALGMIAATGGAADVATHALIQQKSYSSGQALKDFAGGAASSGSMILGGELTAKALGVGKEIAASASANVIKTAEGISSREGTSLIAPARQGELASSMQKMIEEKIGAGRDTVDRASLEKLAVKFASHPEQSKEVTALTNLMQASLANQIGSRFTTAMQTARVQSIGFGTGGALGAAADYDGKKSLQENLGNIGGAAIISGTLGALPGFGKGVFGKAAQDSHGLEPVIADKVSDLPKPSPVVESRPVNTSTAALSELAGKGGLDAKETALLNARMAEFKQKHPEANLVPPSELSQMDDRTLAEHVLRQAQENSIASYYTATKDYANDITNRAGMEAAFHDLERKGEWASKEATVVNLTNFKAANDVFDHHTGDMVLQAMSKYLKTVGFDSEAGLAVKLQGDKFVMVGKKGQTEQLEHLLKDVKIYATDDSVTLSGRKGSEPVTLTVDKKGKVTTGSEAFEPPAGKQVQVTAFRDRSVSTIDEAGKVRSVNDVLNEIYGAGPKPVAPTIKVSGISEQALADGAAQRATAEEARANLNSGGSLSDSVMDMARRGALDNGQLSREELITLSTLMRAENPSATAAYATERGTGLVSKEHYEHLLEMGAHKDTVSGVIVADVKGFGNLNGISTFNREALGGGRLVGDSGIEVMSDALRDAIKKANLPESVAKDITLARIGGDEIGVILPKQISQADRQKVLESVDSIRLAVKVEERDGAGNAKSIAIRKYEPGEKLRPGELDVGIAAGLSTMEDARREMQLRGAIYNKLVQGDVNAARQALHDGASTSGLSRSRLNSLEEDFERATTNPEVMNPSLDKVLQAQGDRASEHIKKMEKEFHVLSAGESEIAQKVMAELKENNIARASQLLSGSGLTDQSRASLKEVLDSLGHGEISSGQAASIFGDRITYSQAHPEYAGKAIKIGRFGTTEYPNTFVGFSQRSLSEYPKVIRENGQNHVIKIPATEFRGAYVDSKGVTVDGVVAVMSADGKTVLGGRLKELQDEAVALHLHGQYRQAQERLRQADQLYYQVGRSTDSDLAGRTVTDS